MILLNASGQHGGLFSGFWTPVLVLLMVVSGYADDDPSSTGPIREIRAGVIGHDVDGLWSGDSKEKGPDLGLEVLFNRALFHLFCAAAYPNAGISLNTRGDTSKAYGGVLLKWEPNSAFFFSAGLGLALHNGKRDTDSADRKSLGAQVLFRIPIEIGYAFNRRHRLIIVFDHLSNAYLASPNEGMDNLGLVYGYRF